MSSLLVEEIYSQIWSRLVSQEYPPESRLSVDHLAREFSISQTPIRQALVRLQSEGHVVNRKNAGFSVAPLPSKLDVIASLEFRLITEPEAAKLCTRHLTEDGLQELYKLVEELEALVTGSAETYGRFSATDFAFHDKIAELSGNRFLRNALLDLRRKMVAFRMSFSPGLRRDLQDEHITLMQAISARDEDGAFDAMYTHSAANIRRVKST